MTAPALSPASVVELSAKSLLDIQESAANRALTVNQRQQASKYQRALVDGIRDLPQGETSEYVRRMAADLAKNPNEVSDDSIELAATIARTVSFEQLRGSDDLPALTRLAPSQALGEVSFRSMAIDAFNGQARVAEYGWSVRALQSAGGSAIASNFAATLISYQRTLSPMLDPGVVRIVARSDGAPFIQPRLTSDVAAGGTTTAEAGNLSLLDPTISAVTITPAKRGAITKVSSELLEDNDINLEQVVMESAGRAIGIAAGTAFTATLVAGITNGGTASGTATYGASAAYFGWGDLATLYAAVPAPDRAVGSWLVSSDAFAKLYQLRDNNNQPALYTMTGGGQPLLFGRPVYEDPGLAAVGSASKSVVFGNLQRALTVVRRTPLRVEVSRDAYFGTDEVGIRVIDRSAAAVIQATAAAYLVSANT